jgi:hypothetical protein
MLQPTGAPTGYVPVAHLQIDAVRPRPSGFVLRASGEDAAEYLVELHLDLPINDQTRRVLGEMLSQSEFRVWRRTREPLRGRRAPNSQAAKRTSSGGSGA